MNITRYLALLLFSFSFLFMSAETKVTHVHELYSHILSSQSLQIVNRSDGLVGESVLSVDIDSMGRVWLATSNGVCMYNGHEVVSVPQSDHPCRQGHVSQVCVDNEGTVYAATVNGLYRLRIGDDLFEPILREIRIPELLSFIDNRLYIGCREGLYMYDGSRLSKYTFSSSPTSLDNSVRKVIEDPVNKGCVIVASRSAITRLNPVTGKQQRILLKDIFPFEVIVKQIAIIGNKFFLSLADHGVYVSTDRSLHTWKELPQFGLSVNGLVPSPNGNLCISTMGNGAYLVDGNSCDIIQRFNLHEAEANKLPSNLVNCYVRDKRGVDWIGLAYYGLAHNYRINQLFVPFAMDGFTTHGMNTTTMLMRGDDMLVGTMDGFLFVDRKRHKMQSHLPFTLGGGQVVSALTWWRGRYYIGTRNGGVYVFNPLSDDIHKLTFDPMLDGTGISELTVSPQNELCIGTSRGLFVVDSMRHTRRYTEQNSHISGGDITTVLFENKRDAWVFSKGGLTNGIAKWQLSDDIFIKDDYKADFWGNRNINHALFGHDSLLLAYDSKHIYYTDRTLTDYGEIELPRQIMDDKILWFEDDNNGHYWISTEKGLFCTDYNMSEIRHFGQSEGLDSEIILYLCIDSDSVLWACCNNGVYSMDIKRLVNEKGSPSLNSLRLNLTHIIIDGKPLSFGQESVVNSQRYLGLKWNLTSEEVIMCPAIFQSPNSKECIYEYRINESDKWAMTDNGRITLANLSLGNHTLYVRRLGMDNTCESFTVTVLPSAAAYMELVFILVCLTILFLFLRYRKSTHILLKERNAIEEALIESEELRVKSEELVCAHEELSTMNIGNNVAIEACSEQKYRKIRLSQDECVQIECKMRRFLESEHAYRNPELRRTDIAEAIGVSSAKLSQVFSQHLGENYYDFLNRYRLEDFKRLVDAGECDVYTITALSERCGFKRSSFFGTFRKMEGMTPMEYLKHKNVKAKM